MSAMTSLFGRLQSGHNAVLNALNESQGIVELDAHSGLIKSTNRTFAGFTGAQSEALVGQSLTKLCAVESYEKAIAKYSKSHSLGEGGELYMPVDARHGRIWLLLNFVPAMDKTGGLDTIVVFAQDATKRKAGRTRIAPRALAPPECMSTENR